MQQTIRLKNIKTQQSTILQRISHLASSPTLDTHLVQDLVKTLQHNVTNIEQLCSKSQATPANLTSVSRSIYAWMKFLTDLNHLQLHLQTTRRVWQMALSAYRANNQNLEGVVVELTNMAGLYKSRCSANAATLTISEGFINANDKVLKALVTAAVLGNTQPYTTMIREFASSEEYSDVLLELDLITEAIAENAKGNCYDLDKIFNKVNKEYFAATVGKPRLTWSKIHTYRKFGHYEPARDRVAISLTLDDARIPEFVVEFVMYHELLHKHHGEKWSNGRRMVHTPEFRLDERRFKLYKEAEECLNKLANGSDRSDIAAIYFNL